MASRPRRKRPPLLQFYEHGRGSYSAMVEQVAHGGDGTYASSHDLRTGMSSIISPIVLGARHHWCPQTKCAPNLRTGSSSRVDLMSSSNPSSLRRVVSS